MRRIPLQKPEAGSATSPEIVARIDKRGLMLYVATPWLPSVLLFLVCTGGLSNLCLVLGSTLILSHAAPVYRGRALSLTMIGYGLSPLGTWPAGAIADQVGVPWVTGVQGAVAAAVLGLVAVFRPELRRVDWAIEPVTLVSEMPTESASDRTQVRDGVEETRVIQPSEKLAPKMNLSVLLWFTVLVLPWALLALIPDMPPAYIWIFVVVNALWLIPTLVLVPLYCRSISYEFGETELVVRRGIITRSEDTIPYHMITNIVVRRGPLDRWLGMGSLHVHTAGFSQQQGAEAKLVGLVDFEAVRDTILEAARRSHAGTQPLAAEMPAADAKANLAEIGNAILAELQAVRSRLERS